jgi:DmsE family decaheme c-type cytochrome
MRLLRRYSPHARGLDQINAKNSKGLSRSPALFAMLGLIVGVLLGSSGAGRSNDLDDRDASIAALRSYVQSVSVAQPPLTAAADQDAGGVGTGFAPVNTVSERPDEVEARSDPVTRLRGYLQWVALGQPDAAVFPGRDELDAGDEAGLNVFADRDGLSVRPSTRELPRLAEADNAFDALRELFRGPSSAPPPARLPARPLTPTAHPNISEPAIPSNPIGSKACLECHSPQWDVFGYTIMGRLQKQGKMQCETCHGPGSAHVQAVGCAACHGDGGITTRPGMPSLVGLDPQYLVTAMKAYVTGQRKHALMKALLQNLSEAELNNIAYYYARQTAARAQTPLVGDPAAGRSAVAMATCADCHGAQGVSVYPGWPSLAGQDSRSLADALRAYKDGSRSKVIACAGCHGENGISRRSGMPSLAGLDPQYLVTGMKAYVNGQRKHSLKRALLAGLSDAELKGIAEYYAQQVPAKAQTSAGGDPAAGKADSESCAGCHGEHGVSENPEWPSLAGQDAQYFIDAMHAYKNGSRKDETMQGVLAGVDDKMIIDMAAYYAGLQPAKPHSAGGAVAKREPVVVRNGLVASLDARTINNIASYYATLPPAQPRVAPNAPRHEPALVLKAAPVDGRSLGGIISFRPNDPSRRVEDNNRICLGCHERGERVYWVGGVHETRDLACSDCHAVMRNVSAKAQLKTPFEPDTCFQCHKDSRAQMFRSSHMPLREGKIVCSDCHNPHGSATEAMLRENSINDNCYKCHAEKRGPFLFEHAPVRENCTSCHNPHGSINAASLKMSQPRMCYECHTIGHTQAGTNSQFTMGRGCLNCHTQIHGSNSPAGGVFQR